MKRLLTLLMLMLPMLTFADEAKQNRGLIAFANGNYVQVEWRARATDDPFHTKYLLYANNNLVGTYTTKTTVRVSKSSYSSATFSLVVQDKDGNEIDRQEGVKPWSSECLDIPLQAPVVKDTNADTVLATYTPLDASAYDVDGDGEQELIFKWEAHRKAGAAVSDGHEFVDCYKLDGTRLWRIDFGQNISQGNRFSFAVWDFDGDGKGEMIVKTAPGTKDSNGNYVGEGLPGYPDDLDKIYTRGSEESPTDGEEWITCFDAVTGKELKSMQYWPYFGIHSDWEPGSKVDGITYGHRGNWLLTAVIKIPCRDGSTRPTCYFQRGIYTYVYAMDVSWDGTNLVEEWRNSSTSPTMSVTVNSTGTHTQNISLYGEGAHTCQAGDLDGDGYDEVCIGAAAIDHDGTTLWSTGLGHGDAMAVGEFNPDNEGLETWRITENATAYNACMIDGKTGTILNGQPLTGGDVDRGMILDMDSIYAGSEYIHNGSTYVFDCNGNTLYEDKRNGETTSVLGYPNFRIFWDGDLLEEHFDARWGVAKLNLNTHVWSRMTKPASNQALWYFYNTSYTNSTKDNANLICDILGDFREEIIVYASASSPKINRTDCDYVMRIITSTYDTDKMLPWLRDDNTYNLQIANQNVGYSMPPHLGYNAYAWYKNLVLTGVTKVNAKSTRDEYWHTLQGIRLPTKPATHGVYLHNGKAVVVK